MVMPGFGLMAKLPVPKMQLDPTNIKDVFRLASRFRHEGIEQPKEVEFDSIAPQLLPHIANLNQRFEAELQDFLVRHNLTIEELKRDYQRGYVQQIDGSTVHIWEWIERVDRHTVGIPADALHYSIEFKVNTEG